MEPESVSDYSKKQYWDKRYEKEPTYDWFPSVYSECLSRLIDQLYTRFVVDVPEEKRQKEIRVLHLGIGNSRLVHDLATSWYAKLKEGSSVSENNKKDGDEKEKEEEESENNKTSPPPAAQVIDLKQVAIDYSTVVIENMKKGEQPPVGPSVDWEVADIRDLTGIVPKKRSDEDEKKDMEQQQADLRDDESLYFDVVIDKGTMDAIQADKDSDTLDEDIHAMLMETSRVLKNNNRSVFFQVTWEVQAFRKYWTLREDYLWKNSDYKSMNLNPDSSGDSLYRILRYVKRGNDE